MYNYAEIARRLPEKGDPLEDLRKQAYIPGFCVAYLDKGGNISYKPYGLTSGCGLVEMTRDPTTIPFEDLNLQGLDTVILFNKALYYADQSKQVITKIEAQQENKDSFVQLMTGCHHAYKLADQNELELIHTVLGRPLPERITPDTLFGGASLTKPVLAYLVLKLAASGKYTHNGMPFSLETKLNEILPFKTFLERNKDKFSWREQPGDDKRMAELTAAMILSHTSGLDLFNGFPAEFQSEPGNEYIYSGLGIIYLQQVIEELTKKPIEALGREYLFDSMMKHSSFYPPYEVGLMSEGERNPNKIYLASSSMGLRYEVIGPDKALKTGTIPWNELGESRPQTDPAKLMSNEKFLSILLDHTSQIGHTEPAIAAYSLHTTAEDYIHFLQAWMQDPELKKAFIPVKYMTDDTWAKQFVPEEDCKQVAWGLGWGLQVEKDKKVKVYHTADKDNWRAVAVMDPEAGTAIVCLCNSRNGHLLIEPVVSKNGELDHALNYFFKKYGFSRTVDELAFEPERMKKIGTFLTERKQVSIAKPQALQTEEKTIDSDQTCIKTPGI